MKLRVLLFMPGCPTIRTAATYPPEVEMVLKPNAETKSYRTLFDRQHVLTVYYYRCETDILSCGQPGLTPYRAHGHERY